MTARRWPQVKRLRTAEAFRQRLDELGVELPFADPPAIDALAAPIEIADRRAANRFAILPMEGWDGTEDGRPTDLVRRRWARFGTSGAGLVWGGEAFAVDADGRANPHQLCRGPSSAEDLGELRELLSPTQVCGLQLTHSGRWSLSSRPARPDELLDARRTGALLSELELDRLADAYAATAVLARDAGFDFVDVKACHGYLQHELLGGPGPVEQRARWLRTTVERVRAAAPTMAVGLRVSAFDVVPHHASADGAGVPDADLSTPFGLAPAEVPALLSLLDVDLVCVTAGSPYYCPHVQRPAYFPPTDGYMPPDDPLVAVSALVTAAIDVAAALPDATVVASGLSYLQEWLPHVASAVVRDSGVHVAGIGRLALSYPDLPSDVLAGRALDSRRLCRTFSDCTTAPRNGLVSGCWPLDEFYKSRPERVELAAAKKGGVVAQPTAATTEPLVRGAAVVGLGIGTMHVRALRRLPGRFRVVAVCDPDESRATPVAERIKADVCSFEEVLGRDDVDIVHICTPPALHLAQCLSALEAGKHVVCEKPVVASLAEIDRLIAAEADAATCVMPVFQYRFGNGLQQVKALIDAGIAGQAYTSSVEVAWRRRAEYYAAPWRGKWTTELGGVLLSQAIHALDMLTYVAGPPARVFCRTTTRVNPIEVEDCAAASLELRDGSLATITATLGSPEEVSRHRFHFAGFSAESGTEAYTSSGPPWTITPDTPESATAIEHALAGWVEQPEEWQGQFLHFADALDSGAAPPVTLVDARASLELLTAMYWSARSGDDVPLPLAGSHPLYEGWLP